MAKDTNKTEKVAEEKEPTVKKTILVKKAGEFGYYKGRSYKVLTGNAKGAGIWGDTGECFAINDLFELAKKEGLA